MRRTLEKLAQERQEKEKAFALKLDEIRQKLHSLDQVGGFLRLKKRGQKITSTSDLLANLANLIELQSLLMDARDREWDALGSNHVGMIFKSMEWRVEKLAAEYEDVKALMKTFLLLREKLGRLLAVLEEKRLPEATAVREILEPLEDWRYAGFENRFRGPADEVKHQLEAYVFYFLKGGKVVDLGCGRGEFLELLRENGVAAEGIDINSQMVEACLDKGLPCRKSDLLEGLGEWADRSLDGIFSSQVIEHLTPSYLKRLAELCYQKLASSGTLIWETINPASVFALVQIYYLDLSHQKPVHPQALKFMLEAAGFENIEIKYSLSLDRQKLKNLPGADEPTSILNENIDSLNELLFAPPNYAAIARRK
jgi:2-polyprenyl-3-methyl-5-hydroxy-6-metoxy-1,4-benzoquinol methylase